MKPREFWIGMDTTGKVIPIAKEEPLTEDDHFNHGYMLNLICQTIEKSAYEQVCKERDLYKAISEKLAAALRYYSNDTNNCLCTKSDASTATEALEQYEKMKGELG